MTTTTSFEKQVSRLQRFSFLLNKSGGVARIEDKSGNWIEHIQAAHIAEAADNALAELREEFEQYKKDHPPAGSSTQLEEPSEAPSEIEYDGSLRQVSVNTLATLIHLRNSSFSTDNYISFRGEPGDSDFVTKKMLHSKEFGNVLSFVMNSPLGLDILLENLPTGHKTVYTKISSSEWTASHPA